jgi:hypothetical protein
MKNKLFWFVTFIAFVTLSGCLDGGGGGGSSDSGTSGTSSSSSDDSNVILNLDFSTMFLGDENMVNANLNVSNIDLSVNDSVIESSGFPISFATETFSGTLVLLNDNDDSVAYTFPITATMDSSWDANLQQSIVVKPGAYKFNIQFQKNSYQYLGTTTATVLEGDNTINLNINPVIGDTLVTTTVIETPTFWFNYPAADFNSLADPELDVIVDGSADTTLVLAQFTDGVGERVYFNLNGNHNIELLLRDGTTDVARFEQTSINFQAGIDVTLNLTAIFGRVAIGLTESGGDATFDFFIPSEVVDEVGGLLNLRATFSLNGANNDPTSDILSLVVDASDDYTASTIISGIQYDTLSMSLQFEDIALSETIGTCNFDVTVDVSADSGSCAITLIRKAVISGRFHQVVAVNVVDATGDAVSGAFIWHNDGSGDTQWATATGSDAAYADGYVEMTIPIGSYNFRAEYNDGSSDFSSNDVSADIDAFNTGYLLLYLNN